jgi:hypothetical protein
MCVPKEISAERDISCHNSSLMQTKEYVDSRVAAVKNTPYFTSVMLLFFWSFGIIDVSTIKC